MLVVQKIKFHNILLCLRNLSRHKQRPWHNPGHKQLVGRFSTGFRSSALAASTAINFDGYLA
jgi:hypothetical protein